MKQGILLMLQKCVESSKESFTRKADVNFVLTWLWDSILGSTDLTCSFLFLLFLIN